MGQQHQQWLQYWQLQRLHAVMRLQRFLHGLQPRQLRLDW